MGHRGSAHHLRRGAGSATSWPIPRSAAAAPASRSRSPRTFVSFERCGLVMQPDDKDAALLPRRINGSFALIHRPVTDSGAHVWISFSPDLRNWGGHKLVLPARRGAWWDANHVGLSPPLIETAARLADALSRRAPNRRPGVCIAWAWRCSTWRPPSSCLLRGDSWIFGPEAPYEARGRRRLRHVSVRLHARRRRRHHQPLLRRGGHQHRAGDRQHRANCSIGWIGMGRRRSHPAAHVNRRATSPVRG